MSSSMRLTVEVALCTTGRPSICHTVESLARQTRKPDRLIVVHQSDEPGLLEASLREVYEGPLEYIHDDGRGLARARNIALKGSFGDWLMWCDDDEEVAPDWAAQLQYLAEAFPHVSFFGGPMIPPAIIPEGNHVDELYAAGNRILDEESFLTNPSGQPGSSLDCWGGNMAYRCSCMEAVGTFDERLGAGSEEFPYAEETEYHMRAITAGFVGMLSPRMAIYHESGARPVNSSAQEGKLKSCAAIVWKSRKDPALISPKLAARVTPFGQKRAFLSRITSGFVYAEHGRAQAEFEELLRQIDARFELRNGLMWPRGVGS